MRILPVVKAYPVLDQVSFSEAVCVAGVTADAPHRWVRLFPLDFRGLEMAQRFSKYAFIDLEAQKCKTDPRPESYTPVLDSCISPASTSTRTAARGGGAWSCSTC
jgi:hypothetical protein